MYLYPRYERKVASCLNILLPAAIRAGLTAKDPYAAHPAPRAAHIPHPAAALPEPALPAAAQPVPRAIVLPRVQDPPAIALPRAAVPLPAGESAPSPVSSSFWA